MLHLRWLALVALVVPFALFSPGCACGDAPVTTEDDPVVAAPTPPADGGTGACLVDEDCPFGDVCQNGGCRPSEPELHDEGCWSDADCAAGQRCALASGRCVDEASFPEVVDGGADAACDENETRFCGTKVGACDYGVERCAGGAWSGSCEGGVRPADAELCDGIDNDCDGDVDEGFTLNVTCSDGLGVCQQVGVSVCSADGTGTVCSAVGLDPSGRQELCANNLDDDCDGTPDEGFDLNVACDVGTGACARSGVTTCSSDGLATVCSASAGTPADAELCGNEPDDDCDGVLDDDEGFGTLADSCSVGTGACQRSGQVVCSADELGVRCSASAATGANTELCGGNPDDDCDGELEEGFAAVGTSCLVGTGDCQVPGQLACTADRLGLQCVPIGGGAEVCDGDDNDMDTCIDEDFDVGVSCSVGFGVCRATGLKVCRADASGTECDAVEGTPGALDLCGNDLDDDCDDEVDEGFPTLGNSCSDGVGICKRTGFLVCSADGASAVCNVSAGQPGAFGELCGNNKDDDCDGTPDEADAFPDLGDACTVGIGACQVTGQRVCAADGRGTVCSATPAAPGANEICGNGIDDDCDGDEDEGYDLGLACDVGDGICQRSGVMVCDGLTASKCNAAPGNPNPAGELCNNGDDDDCDGFTDEGFENLGQDCQVGIGECRRQGDYVCSADLTTTVCSVNPGGAVPEVCDNKDNNCDTFVDNGCDDDDDDYCDVTMSFASAGAVTVCPLSTSNVSTHDCNDDDRNVSPGVTEVCFDAKDQNCDGDPDDGCPVCDTGIDRDFDGANECVDCDDTNGAVFPAASERCDGLDNDCDGQLDEDFDGDGDGYTTCGTIPSAGGLDSAYVDCNDAAANVYPLACELCSVSGGANGACGDIGVAGNGIDEDCDGYIDEACAPCSSTDSDNDGLSQCEGDCAPLENDAFPGNPERCDGIDNDCNVFTTDNCGVGEDCNWAGDPSPDTCKEDLFCVEELTGGGGGSGRFHCTSWCNSTPLNLGLGDGCAAGESCSSRITPTANMHGCNTGTVVGTAATGSQCDDGTDCRSGWCTQGGPPASRYCLDFCASDAYCGGDTVCQLSGDTGVCFKPLSSQTGDVGASCTTGSNCRSGPRACLTMGGSKQCSRACCTNSDCPSNWYCGLNGNASDSPQPGTAVDTVPMCWPESASNGARPAGAQCDSNSQCASEFCDQNLNQCIDLCCNDDTCPTGLSCQDVVVNKTEGSLTGPTFARVCVNVTPAEPLEKK